MRFPRTPHFKGCDPILIEIVKRNWLPILIAVSILTFIFFLNQDPFEIKKDQLTPVETIGEIEPSNEVLPERTTVIVDIKGEIAQPGIYEVDTDSRIHDVIALAGGFSAEADQTHVNLAQKVHDEMMIIVPKVGEDIMTVGSNTSSGSGKVRVNYATQDEIETLSGIGPSKAQAIIQYRDEHGFFKTVEDLLQISGIGEKTLENIKDDIQIP